MKPAGIVIDKFGGLTATARALSTETREFPVSTVQGWKQRGRIPERYWGRLASEAVKIGVPLVGDDFLPKSVSSILNQFSQEDVC